MPYPTKGQVSIDWYWLSFNWLEFRGLLSCPCTQSQMSAGRLLNRKAEAMNWFEAWGELFNHWFGCLLLVQSKETYKPIKNVHHYVNTH